MTSKPHKVIIFDTNAALAENYLRSGAARSLGRGANLLDISIFVPEIVIDEMNGNFERTLGEELNKLLKTQQRLKTLGHL